MAYTRATPEMNHYERDTGEMGVYDEGSIVEQELTEAAEGGTNESAGFVSLSKDVGRKPDEDRVEIEAPADESASGGGVDYTKYPASGESDSEDSDSDSDEIDGQDESFDGVLIPLDTDEREVQRSLQCSSEALELALAAATDALSYEVVDLVRGADSGKTDQFDVLAAVGRIESRSQTVSLLAIEMFELDEFRRNGPVLGRSVGESAGAGLGPAEFSASAKVEGYDSAPVVSESEPASEPELPLLERLGLNDAHAARAQAGAREVKARMRARSKVEQIEEGLLRLFAGHEPVDVAEAVDVSPATVHRWARTLDEIESGTETEGEVRQDVG